MSIDIGALLQLLVGAGLMGIVGHLWRRLNRLNDLAVQWETLLKNVDIVQVNADMISVRARLASRPDGTTPLLDRVHSQINLLKRDVAALQRGTNGVVRADHRNGER